MNVKRKYPQSHASRVVTWEACLRRRYHTYTNDICTHRAVKAKSVSLTHPLGRELGVRSVLPLPGPYTSHRHRRRLGRRGRHDHGRRGRRTDTIADTIAAALGVALGVAATVLLALVNRRLPVPRWHRGCSRRSTLRALKLLLLKTVKAECQQETRQDGAGIDAQVVVKSGTHRGPPECRYTRTAKKV